MPLTTIRVLLVEDEIMIRMMVADMVEELGHAVTAEAGYVGHATELAQTGLFDLAILDVNLNSKLSFPRLVTRRIIIPPPFDRHPGCKSPFKSRRLPWRLPRPLRASAISGWSTPFDTANYISEATQAPAAITALAGRRRDADHGCGRPRSPAGAPAAFTLGLPVPAAPFSCGLTDPGVPWPYSAGRRPTSNPSCWSATAYCRASHPSRTNASAYRARGPRRCA
jgi:hypothetical protein